MGQLEYYNQRDKKVATIDLQGINRSYYTNPVTQQRDSSTESRQASAKVHPCCTKEPYHRATVNQFIAPDYEPIFTDTTKAHLDAPHDEYNTSMTTTTNDFHSSVPHVHTLQDMGKYIGVPRMGDFNPNKYMCLTDSDRHYLIPPEEASAFTAAATRPIMEQLEQSLTTPKDEYTQPEATIHTMEEDAQGQRLAERPPEVEPQPVELHLPQPEEQQPVDVPPAQPEGQPQEDINRAPPRPPRVRFHLPPEAPIADHISPPHRKEPDKHRRKPDPPQSLSVQERENQKSTPNCTKHNTQAKAVKASQLECETWHMRLGHPGPQKLIKTAKCTNSIPMMGNLHPMFDCESCIRSKLTKAPKGKVETCEATKPGERYHMDFGFVRGPKYIAST